MGSKQGSPSKDEINSINEDDVFSPLISITDSDHDSESEVGIVTDMDENILDSTENTQGSAKNSISSLRVSSSSSSSESSSNLFQTDTKILKESNTFSNGSPKYEEEGQSPNKKEVSDENNNISSKSQESDNASPTNDDSQVSHPPNKPTSQTMSPIQLPPRQVMERFGDYDPNRIPASVFGNRPSSAMDWSVASNDSLFSLNLGSNSFSREQFLMISGELLDEDNKKSVELYNSGELSKPGEANKSGLPPLSPIGKLRKIKTMDADKKIMDADKRSKQAQLTDEDITEQFEKKKSELDGNGNSSMTSRPSDASATSSQSFAFPILVDTTKYNSMKGTFPRKQDPKLDVYSESPQMKMHKKKSSSRWQCCSCYYCSLAECSCLSSRHCGSWKWFKKWCCCCCCDNSSSPQSSSPSHHHCWSWKSCKKGCCCCC